MDELESTPLPVNGVLDLHTFRPQDVGDLVPTYLEECRKLGITQVRIIHGKGIGALRETVHAVLRRLPAVKSFGLAPETGGGWGATVLELKRYSKEATMDKDMQDRFATLWAKYFDGAGLPVCLFYSNDESCGQLLRPIKGHTCMIGQLTAVRKGQDLAFVGDSIGCAGGKRYLGFQTEIRPDFEYFLSCGIPGKMEGERYKKTPELVRELMKRAPVFKAPAKYAVFKRWDKLQAGDNPEVVIFFASPDVLSGLFTLAGFDQADLNGVMTPFGAGCATIAQYPYLEREKSEPRAVIGMFDVSARPCVPENVLTFAVPMTKFTRMVNDMEESFLITGSWGKVRRRIGSQQPVVELGEGRRN